ncbi:MAG: hypothetical protein RJA76_1217 [Bacteroidota bacterium]|jgi:hypothetical protein
MKKLLFKFYFLFTIISFNCFSQNENQLNDNELFKDLLDFGYNYIGKNLTLKCKFVRIDNDQLPYTPEAFNTSIGGGLEVYYNANETRKLVGFVIKPNNEEIVNDYFYKAYGEQKIILNTLKKLKENDIIIITGKIIAWPVNDEIGFKINKIEKEKPKEEVNSQKIEPDKNEELGYIIGIVVAILFIIIGITAFRQ